MEDLENSINKQDGMSFLKGFTAARIGIGRTGTSIPVEQYLDLKLAHAHARDAVYSSLEIDSLMDSVANFNLPVLCLESKVADRAEYLQRPDLGRQLSQHSVKELAKQIKNFDVLICIADGLSALAVQQNASELLALLIPTLLKDGLTIGPICLIRQARVAVADDVAQNLQAKLALILIGERPGLSSVDSMGAYLTYNPKKGSTDELRNCVSNIRRAGLPTQIAAGKIIYLIREAFRQKKSGVTLKDNQDLFLD